MKDFKPQNILVIDFGQMGDIVLSLPALRAIREKFPKAKITLAVGKSGAAVLDLANVCDEKIVVDRVALRDGNKLRSIYEMARIVRDVRRRKFDFVIDLHSLSETNLLGFISGAENRLYSRRKNRSLDFLSTFTIPFEDREKHATERYLDVLKPLGIENISPAPHLEARQSDLDFIEKLWQKEKVKGLTVGIFPGAGNESRKWKLEKFAELADFLQRNEKVNVAIFPGPEERAMIPEIRAKFPANTLIYDKLNFFQFVAALSRLSLFISNDTGPMHLASALGTPIVLILDKRATKEFVPLVKQIEVVNNDIIDKISVEGVYAASQKMLAANRVESILARK